MRRGGADSLCVSAISFWELELLRRKQRIRFPDDVGRWRGELLAQGVIEISVDGSIGIRAGGPPGLSRGSGGPGDRGNGAGGAPVGDGGSEHFGVVGGVGSVGCEGVSWAWNSLSRWTAHPPARGIRKERWVWRGLLLLSTGAGGSSHPHPALSLKGEGKMGGLVGLARVAALEHWCWGWQPPSPPDQVRGRLCPLSKARERWGLGGFWGELKDRWGGGALR